MDNNAACPHLSPICPAESNMHTRFVLLRDILLYARAGREVSLPVCIICFGRRVHVHTCESRTGRRRRRGLACEDLEGCTSALREMHEVARSLYLVAAKLFSCRYLTRQILMWTCQW